MPRLTHAGGRPVAHTRPRRAPSRLAAWVLSALVVSGGAGTWAEAATQPLPACVAMIREQPSGTEVELLGSCVTDRGIALPRDRSFDGNGYTIHVVDPPGRPFVGGVLWRIGGTATLSDVTIDGSGLGADCANARYAGVWLERAGGRVTRVQVEHLLRDGADDCTFDWSIGVLLSGPGPATGAAAADRATGTGPDGTPLAARPATPPGSVATPGPDSSRVTLTENAVSGVEFGVVSDGAVADLRGGRLLGSIDGMFAVDAGTAVHATGVEIVGGQVGAEAGAGASLTLTDATVGAAEVGILARDAGTALLVEGGSVVEYDARGTLRATRVTGVERVAVVARTGAAVEVRDDTLLAGGVSGLVAVGAGTRATAVGSRIDLGAKGAAIAEDGAHLILGGNRIGPGAAAATPAATPLPLPAAAASPKAARPAGVLPAAVTLLGRGTTGEVTDNQIADAPDEGVLFLLGATGRVAGNTVDRSGSAGIDVTGGGPRVEITDNDVRGGDVGIRLTQGADASVTGNRVSGTHTGIAAGLTGTRATVTGNDVSATSWTGIGVVDGAMAVVTDNRVTDPAMSGVLVTDAGTTATVARNQLVGAGRNGVTVDAGAKAKIVGNVVERPAVVGLAVDGGAVATLVDNEVRDAGTIGIRVGGGARGTLAANRVERSRRTGILVTGPGTTAALSGNRVADAGLNGIGIEQGASATVAGSEVSGTSAGIGIAAFSGSTAEVRDGNRVVGAKTGLGASGAGTHATFADNVIVDPAESGILVVDGAIATVRGNRVGGGKYGVRVTDAASQSTIEGNTVAGAETGVEVDRGASATLTGLNRVSGGKWGIVASGPGSTATISGATVTWSANQALVAADEGYLTAVLTEIGHTSTGVLAFSGGRLVLGEGTTIRSTKNQGVRASGRGSIARLNGAVVTVGRGDAALAEEGGIVEIADATLTAAGTAQSLNGVVARGIGSRGTIADSTIILTGPVGRGVVANLGAAISVSGGTVRAATGIRADGYGTTATIRDTRITDAANVGIRVEDATATIDRVAVAGAPLGIELVETPRADVADATVALAPSPRSERLARGIRVSGGAATLRGNVVTGDPAAAFAVNDCGIWIGPDAAATLADNTIHLPGYATPVCDERAGPPSATPVATPVR